MEKFVEMIQNADFMKHVPEEDRPDATAALRLYAGFVTKGLVADLRGDEAARSRAYESARHAALVLSSIASGVAIEAAREALQKVTIDATQKMMVESLKKVQEGIATTHHE